MARAFVNADFSIGNPRPTATVDEFIVDLPVVYLGNDLPAGLNGVDKSIVAVTLLFGDTLTQMGTKIGNAVRTQATGLGYTVVNNGVLVSSLVKV
jgi:hypothetical protein